MGQTRTPVPVTPLVAMLAGQPEFFQAARALLEKLLGPVELESPIYPFGVTAYYTPTMGPALLRQFFSFQNLADPAELPAWKLATNVSEANLRQSLPAAVERPINLDPGYLTGAKLVLASTKDFAHRLYLRNGIFAEITLSFRGDKWVGHQFTFPDFKSGGYDEFLCRAREQHLCKMKEWRALDSGL